MSLNDETYLDLITPVIMINLLKVVIHNKTLLVKFSASPKLDEVYQRTGGSFAPAAPV